MTETPKPESRWRISRRILIAAAILATLVAVFYTEEDWRGKHAWENYKREAAARGHVLDWEQFIPPPVPDDQNIFKAPHMQEWFVRNPTATNNELNLLIRNPVKTANITDKTDAANFLAWSEQFQPDFDLMREALKRPDARMDGDYTVPYEIPIVNFVNIRAVAQALAQRAKCDLLLGHPGKALDELTLLNDSRRLMERAPTGKPITLVDAMVNVAVTGLYAETIAKGFQNHTWQEPQLTALQEQLEAINLPGIVAQSFQTEPAATTYTIETAPKAKLRDWFSISPKNLRWAFWPMLKWELLPRGWIYQNMATSARMTYSQSEGFDAASGFIEPKKFGNVDHDLKKVAWPYSFMAVAAIPNFTKAWQTTAYNQTTVNEAQIACALERYYLAYGQYPDTLDALAPKFIQTIPNDIIGGQPLHYRRTDDGKFLLYSVGWNETDDGGQQSRQRNANGGLANYAQGDWVWPPPPR
jgi:hypothetical protein